MKNRKRAPSTRKVRRDVRQGKRGSGWDMQRQGRRIRRPDPRKVVVQEDAKNLTGAAGIAGFGAFLREQGVDAELQGLFGQMKSGLWVVYPMAAQLRLLIDLHVIGEGRVFGLEALAHDPLLRKLAGDAIPSIDILYDDLQRFNPETIAILESMVASRASKELRASKLKEIHIDIDTTVTPLFGNQEGALLGYNPRFHGRVSYHPMLARVAEIDMICGAQLRHGDRGFGDEDVPVIVGWRKRVREAVGPDCLIHVRIDAAGDCTALLRQFETLGVWYYTKARVTPDLAAATTRCRSWKSLDHDAMNRPTRQGAEIAFQRDEWNKAGLSPRVVAIRSRERDNGKQLYLWNDLDYTVQCWITNNAIATIDELADVYNDRAGIEPLIAELKNNWCIGKAPSAHFDANHAAFLVKLLAYNLFRQYVRSHYPTIASWRTAWLRRTTILRPGRIARSGRRTVLHTTTIDVPMQC